MELEFSGPIWIWKGPAPYYFVTVPDDECRAIELVSPIVSYGWGMIPVTVRTGETTWTTALWPKDGAYVVPLKDAVRAAEDLAEGDVAALRLTIDVEGAAAHRRVGVGGDDVIEPGCPNFVGQGNVAPHSASRSCPSRATPAGLPNCCIGVA